MPTKPTPRTTPVTTGTVVLAAGAMLTLAACVPTAGEPPQSGQVGRSATTARAPTTASTAPVVAPTAGIPRVPPGWTSTTQPTTLRALDPVPLAGDVIDPRATWSTTQPAKTYTVKPGDTLTSIARQHKTTVAALKKANPTINPDVIQANQKLNLP